MQFWGITDRGSIRKENQDTYSFYKIDEKTGFCVVCDGMGGARAGSVASTLAEETFSNTLRRELPNIPDEQRITFLNDVISQVNQTLYQRSTTEEKCHGMGTTMVAAIADGIRVFVLNIGDSRCYWIHDDSIEQVTRDHSLVGDLVARGDITPEEARSHPRKNLITRALGVDQIVHPDLFELEQKSASFLLLCSDGLSNLLTDQELLHEVLHGGDLDSCCQRLLDIALTRGAPDNVTAILMQL